MKNSWIALIATFAMLSYAGVAAAADTANTVKADCLIFTYAADGSNVKTLVSSAFILKKHQKTQILQTQTSTYSAVAEDFSSGKGKTPMASLYLEVLNRKTNLQVAAGSTDWDVGSNIPPIQIYTTDGEPGVKTQFFCQEEK